jgi:acyl-CoA synthetase (AMP-forming)/AMP-acid ligase II
MSDLHRPLLARARAPAPVGARDAPVPQRRGLGDALPAQAVRDLLRHGHHLPALPARDRGHRRLAAAALRRQAGDRVLLVMQNSPQFMAAFYGILRADAVVVPVNPMNLTEELRHYVQRQRRPGGLHRAGAAAAPAAAAARRQPDTWTTPSSPPTATTWKPHRPDRARLRGRAAHALAAPGAVAWAEVLAAGCRPGRSKPGPTTWR